ncbi:hypothetical protein [Gracilinema caldarium]|uniref:Lipoprotein n=1 Tax=Gracilinema caldarium (strain ATCC 51460 / DSM 7334 / H1) TaxID=744872 RepID=F8EWY2_GRAC1|nr:hypothetical protein [Gracilinema caldarium]AEJ18509.1 hypothetical protein Spica_0345 [Gracilinema caldarium DSM 7334]
MKKIWLILAAVAVSLAFLGCPMERDQEYPAYTLPIKVNVDVNTTNTAAIQVTATPTTNSYSKYTIKIVELVADIGKKFVVAGESIGSTTANIGANWNVKAADITDQGLVGTVDATGTFEITFYGKAPSWGTSTDGAKFKICRYDSDWDLVLGDASGGNFSVADSTGNDIELTIDPNKL